MKLSIVLLLKLLIFFGEEGGGVKKEIIYELIFMISKFQKFYSIKILKFRNYSFFFIKLEKKRHNQNKKGTQNFDKHIKTHCKISQP